MQAQENLRYFADPFVIKQLGPRVGYCFPTAMVQLGYPGLIFVHKISNFHNFPNIIKISWELNGNVFANVKKLSRKIDIVKFQFSNFLIPCLVISRLASCMEPLT